MKLVFRKGFFEINIRPFLTTSDLMKCSQTNRELEDVCCTCTLPEVWMTKAHFLDNTDKLERMVAEGFGDDGGDNVGERSARPRRLVLFKEEPMEWWWTYVYHPDHELSVLHQLVDKYIQDAFHLEIRDDLRVQGAGLQHLVSATFGERNVMDIVRTYIHGGRLQLFPPKPVEEALAALSAPGLVQAGPKYWYTAIFGDPLPGVTKMLRLSFRDHTIFFCENEGIDIPMLSDQTSH